MFVTRETIFSEECKGISDSVEKFIPRPHLTLLVNTVDLSGLEHAACPVIVGMNNFLMQFSSGMNRSLMIGIMHWWKFCLCCSPWVKVANAACSWLDAIISLHHRDTFA